MNKKVVRILIVFLVLISISTMCYAGISEANFVNKMPMNVLECIKTIFKYIEYSLLDSLLFLEYVHYGLFKIRLDYYIVIGVIILYAILNFLIIRNKKELAKISLKINSIILLILLLISTLNVTNIINIYELIFIILTLLIISLIFQKVILKKDDEKIKKYNHILKIIIVILSIIEIVVFIITYNYIFSTENNKGDGEILVEILQEHTSPWYFTRYDKEIYTISIGESIAHISENKVLYIDDDGILLEYINKYYKDDDDTKEEDTKGSPFISLSDIINRNLVSEKVQKKLNWNIWYTYSLPESPGIMKDGDTDTYIRVIRNK